MLKSLRAMEASVERIPDGTTRQWAAPQVRELREVLWGLFNTAIAAQSLLRLHEAAGRVEDTTRFAVADQRLQSLGALLGAQADRFSRIRADLEKVEARVVLSGADAAELLRPLDEGSGSALGEIGSIEGQMSAMRDALAELSSRLGPAGTRRRIRRRVVVPSAAMP